MIVDTFTTATCGNGCRGTYEANVSFDVSLTQPGVVQVYESSAMVCSAHYPDPSDARRV